MTEPLKIGIAGLGTVGAGVVKLLAQHNRLLALRGGRRLKLVAVSARSRAKKRDIDPSGVRWEKDPLALATASDIDVVVELIGGSGGIAKRLAERALRAGKHLVTANKALLALHGAELAGLADIFRGRVVDVAADSVIVEITGDAEKLDGLLDLLRPRGIIEMVRTGKVAMLRGTASSSARAAAAELEKGA